MQNLPTHVRDVCKIGQGKACCRYLTIGAVGFECIKHSGFKDYLDHRVATNTITAQGDNCEGKTNLNDIPAPNESVPTPQGQASEV